jgi:hypothetical protein
VIKIVRLAGEAEARRVEHPHTRKRGPYLAGILEIGNIGCVRDFIEAPRHILAHGAKRRGDDKKQQDDGANAPIGIGRGRTILIVRRRIEIIQRKHRASVHGTR